jgi:hypothetical protein
MRHFKEFQKNVVGFVDERVLPTQRVKGYSYYETRHGDNNWCVPLTIELGVCVNFCGTLVTKEPLDLASFIDITAEQGWLLRDMKVPKALHIQLTGHAE